MKKVILYILIFACFCGLIELSVNYSMGQQIENKCPFCESFSSIGANLLESRLDCWGKIKTTSSAKELDQNLISILEHLQLPVNNYEFKHINRDNLNSLEYQCKKSTETFQFILQSDQAQKETYILISVVSKQTDANLPAYERNLKNILDCHCYYLYTGRINYNINPDSQLELLKVVLKKMDAKQIDLYRENNTTSITALSSKLISSVQPVSTGLSKVNLQVAARSNTINHCTYIYIGSPIILGEY